MGREQLTGPITRYIAGKFAEAREGRGTFTKVAAESGVKRATIVRACAGDSSMAVETFVPLALYFGFNPGQLLNEAERATRLETVDQTFLDLAADEAQGMTDRERWEAENENEDPA